MRKQEGELKNNRVQEEEHCEVLKLTTSPKVITNL